MVIIEQLHFEREGKAFFHGLDLKVQPGQLLQITGANGAGKTTLLKLLAGFLHMSKGSISTPTKIYIGHHAGFTDKLTTLENLAFMVKLYRNDSIDLEIILKQFSLSAVKDQLAYTLSAGQQRRLVFAGLLLSSARLWLLDEPFAALDKDAVSLVKTMIQHHLQQQGIVILTSHQDLQWENTHLQSLHLEEQTCRYSG